MGDKGREVEHEGRGVEEHEDNERDTEGRLGDGRRDESDGFQTDRGDRREERRTEGQTGWSKVPTEARGRTAERRDVEGPRWAGRTRDRLRKGVRAGTGRVGGARRRAGVGVGGTPGVAG